MLKNWKRNSFFILTVLLTFTLAACGSSGTGGSNAGSGNGGSKQTTLDFVWFTDGVEGEVMKGLIKEYEDQNPGIKINLIEVAYTDLGTKLRTMVSGGKPPALSRISDTGMFANQALDLSEYLGTAEEFSSQFIDSIKPYYIVDDKVIAAPMDVTANGLIYNKTLFDKAGVSVPTSSDDVWTWEEFSAALKQVQEQGGARFGMVMDVTPHRWSTMLYQFGGSIFNEDGTQAVINDGKAVNALNYFVQLHKDGIMPDSVWIGGENPNNLFRTGTVGVHFSGNWMLSNYKDINNFEWGVTYLPKEEIRSSVPGGKYLMAFKNSGVEEEAAEFIAYLTSKEVNGKYNQESLFISPRKDSAQLDYEFGKEFFEVFTDELNNSTPKAANDWSRQDVITKFTDDLRINIIETLTGKMEPQEALDDVADKANKVIEASN
ncbi:ABC transporter substrate-binding protein [Paenibacillus senegalensis]|uniref:ABC transporter substrate-binding protein n=1 Tax=Paenibacillus senegalensis TaxID=1465766 RepID=UPI00028A1E92|nr:sugar ABC transporter substrate-binding protein [Paenibacillus senegalensis]